MALIVPFNLSSGGYIYIIYLQFSIIDIYITGSDEEELMENLINWKTEAYSSKDNFDNENIEEEELQVFETVDNE